MNQQQCNIESLTIDNTVINIDIIVIIISLYGHSPCKIYHPLSTTNYPHHTPPALLPSLAQVAAHLEVAALLQLTTSGGLLLTAHSLPPPPAPTPGGRTP